MVSREARAENIAMLSAFADVVVNFMGMCRLSPGRYIYEEIHPDACIS
jgi:hypothetical protein